MNRRNFIKIVAAAGAAGAAWKLGCPPHWMELVTCETRILMGTVVQLTLIGGEFGAAEKAARSCFKIMSDLEEQVLSRFQPGSQLSILNQTGELSAPHPLLLKLLRQAQELGDLTEGRFDVTLLPVVDLYQRFEQEGRGIPPKHELEKALTAVNRKELKIQNSRIWLGKKNMSLTLDGIAKGAVVGQGLESLIRAGYPDLLVEAGGDLQVRGTNRGQPWRVGIRNPRPEGEPILVRLAVEDCAVATSGDYQQSYSPDYSRHHILLPDRGQSGGNLASATVVCGDPARADGLATALMTMSAGQSLELVESLPGVEAFLVTKDLETLASSGLPLA